MDATSARLTERLREISKQVRALQREQQTIKKALEIAGINPAEYSEQKEMGPHDLEYMLDIPFEAMSLTDTCLRILADHQGQELTKSEIENFAEMGGCQFKTKNPKNSVAGTLRRLAEEGRCQVRRVKGPQGSKYFMQP
jgi:hypothetical protein